MTSFLACFIPLFVAIDPLGAIPIYMGLTRGMEPKGTRRVIILTMITALAVAMAFMFLGKWIFQFIGISVDDFKIAGGIILLLIALDMVLTAKEREERMDHTVGVVPLGVPLIVGPASITTLLILIDSHGMWWSLAGLGANFVIVALCFFNSDFIARMLGNGGMKALSKIIGLFLAAIAVMMMRVGIHAAFKI